MKELSASKRLELSGVLLTQPDKERRIMAKQPQAQQGRNFTIGAEEIIRIFVEFCTVVKRVTD